MMAVGVFSLSASGKALSLGEKPAAAAQTAQLCSVKPQRCSESPCFQSSLPESWRGVFSSMLRWEFWKGLRQLRNPPSASLLVQESLSLSARLACVPQSGRGWAFQGSAGAWTSVPPPQAAGLEAMLFLWPHIHAAHPHKPATQGACPQSVLSPRAGPSPRSA